MLSNQVQSAHTCLALLGVVVTLVGRLLAKEPQAKTAKTSRAGHQAGDPRIFVLPPKQREHRSSLEDGAEFQAVRRIVQGSRIDDIIGVRQGRRDLVPDLE